MWVLFDPSGAIMLAQKAKPEWTEMKGRKWMRFERKEEKDESSNAR